MSTYKSLDDWNGEIYKSVNSRTDKELWRSITNFESLSDVNIPKGMFDYAAKKQDNSCFMSFKDDSWHNSTCKNDTSSGVSAIEVSRQEDRVGPVSKLYSKIRNRENDLYTNDKSQKVSNNDSCKNKGTTMFNEPFKYYHIYDANNRGDENGGLNEKELYRNIDSLGTSSQLFNINFDQDRGWDVKTKLNKRRACQKQNKTETPINIDESNIQATGVQIGSGLNQKYVTSLIEYKEPNDPILGEYMLKNDVRKSFNENWNSEQSSIEGFIDEPSFFNHRIVKSTIKRPAGWKEGGGVLQGEARGSHWKDWGNWTDNVCKKQSFGGSINSLKSVSFQCNSNVHECGKQQCGCYGNERKSRATIMENCIQKNNCETKFSNISKACSDYYEVCCCENVCNGDRGVDKVCPSSSNRMIFEETSSADAISKPKLSNNSISLLSKQHHSSTTNKDHTSSTCASQAGSGVFLGKDIECQHSGSEVREKSSQTCHEAQCQCVDLSRSDLTQHSPKHENSSPKIASDASERGGETGEHAAHFFDIVFTALGETVRQRPILYILMACWVLSMSVAGFVMIVKYSLGYVTGSRIEMNEDEDWIRKREWAKYYRGCSKHNCN